MALPDTGRNRHDAREWQERPFREEVVCMTMLQERQVVEVTRVPRGFRLTEWVAGIAGLVMAGVGAWMYFVPADWFLGGLAEAWYLGMFAGAGVLLAGGFGLIARRLRLDEVKWTTGAIVAAVVAVAALAGAIIFAAIWLI
jgi:hypothetical protein